MEIALLLLLLLGGARKKASAPAEKSTALAPTFASAWKARVDSLIKRARTGARWEPEMRKHLPAGALAAVRWIGIESGGNPRAQSALNERGLAQTGKASAGEAEWAALGNPKISDSESAHLAAVEIKRGVKGTLRADKTDPTPIEVGMGKLYHGLPILVRELRDQGLLRATPIETLAAMLSGLKIPSGSALPKYVAGSHRVTGDVVRDLALRFVAPAVVVAYGDATATATTEV